MYKFFICLILKLQFRVQIQNIDVFLLCIKKTFTQSVVQSVQLEKQVIKNGIFSAKCGFRE